MFFLIDWFLEQIWVHNKVERKVQKFPTCLLLTQAQPPPHPQRGTLAAVSEPTLTRSDRLKPLQEAQVTLHPWTHTFLKSSHGRKLAPARSWLAGPQALCTGLGESVDRPFLERSPWHCVLSSFCTTLECSHPLFYKLSFLVLFFLFCCPVLPVPINPRSLESGVCGILCFIIQMQSNLHCISPQFHCRIRKSALIF